MPIRPELRHLYRGPAWEAVRARIRDRAGDRCEECGAPNGIQVLRCYKWWTPASLETTMFVARATRNGKPIERLPWHFRDHVNNAHFPLHDRMRHILIQCGAAHLNNVAGDDRDENLAWLCRGCHLALDLKHHKYTRTQRKDAARPLFVLLSAAKGAAQ